MKVILFIGSLLFLLTANSADIYYKKTTQVHDVFIEGKIKKGDYDKFLKILNDIFDITNEEFLGLSHRKNFDELKDKFELGNLHGLARITVNLNSIGGDVNEAVKIGKVARDMLLETSTGNAFIDNEDNLKYQKCWSACFFIWVSGIERSAFSEKGITLGIHRLRFSHDFYKKLTSEQAQIKYKEMQQNAKSILREMDVPDKFYNIMFNTSSNEMYYLSITERRELWGITPYFEELINSKCREFSKTEIERCKLANTSKERWERMNQYFSVKKDI
jgi:hypothetical protein